MRVIRVGEILPCETATGCGKKVMPMPPLARALHLSWLPLVIDHQVARIRVASAGQDVIGRGGRVH